MEALYSFEEYLFGLGGLAILMAEVLTLNGIQDLATAAKSLKRRESEI